MAILKQEAAITEYMCSWCGKTVKQARGEGRPLPGYCPRRPKDKDGCMKPHMWRVNRKYI